MVATEEEVAMQRKPVGSYGVVQRLEELRGVPRGVPVLEASNLLGWFWSACASVLC